MNIQNIWQGNAELDATLSQRWGPVHLAKRKSRLRDFEAEYSSLKFYPSLLLTAEYRNRQQTWTLIY